MLLGAGSLTLAACNDFLDELPDNRTELDTPDKINRLLVSAYPSRSFTRMCEIASDNCDDMGANNPNTSLLLEHNSYWMDMNEAENDSNKNTWQAYYSAIAAANTALEAIEKQGTPCFAGPIRIFASRCSIVSLIILKKVANTWESLTWKLPKRRSIRFITGTISRRYMRKSTGISRRRFLWSAMSTMRFRSTTSTAAPPMPLPRASTSII